ncbi:MAG: GumC family protein [Mariniblastus sp.]
MFEEHSTIAPTDMLRVLARHAFKALIVFSLIVAATIAWIILTPKKYESVAKIYVRLGRESTTLDPSATTGQTVNIQKSLDSEINSMLQILGSHETVKRVVNDIGPDVIIANSISSSGAPVKSEPPSWSLRDWISDLKSSIIKNEFSPTKTETAIKLLRERSSFSAPKDSNVLNIICQAGHPELARKISASWASAFVEEHLRVTRTNGSLSFFADQVEKNKSRLSLVQRELRDAKSEAGLVSIEGQRKILEDQANSIKTRLSTSLASLASTEAKLNSIELTLQAEPDRIENDEKKAIPNGWYELRNKLFDLENLENGLKANKSDLHPEVIAITGQRKALEKILESMNQVTSESTSSPNPTRLLFHQSQLNEQALASALKAESKALEQQAAANLLEFDKLNTHEVVIQELERQILSLETIYLASVASREQSAILEGLELANISSVSLLQKASYSSQAAGIGRLKTLLLGTALAVFAALFVIFTCEYFDHSYATPEQVEQSLSLPVITAIPQDRRETVEVN